jgi:hypothetical protein
MSISINQLEENIQSLDFSIIDNEFVYRFLLCFGLPKSTVSRLRINQQHEPKDHIVIKKKIYFKIIDSIELRLKLDELKQDPQVKGKVRFVVVLNQTQMAVCDTITGEQKVFEIADLATQFEIFSPLIGVEKNNLAFENLADRKASERMSKFYTEIKVYNDFSDEQDIQALNKFLARILFCLFAEDTEIFPKNAFSTALSYTQKDGSDLSEFFIRLFEILNTKVSERKALPDYLQVFPYVNGGLFQEQTKIPIFTTKSRDYLIKNSELDWSQINPDIFGSMVQAVLRNDEKNDNTEHFTSVPNILKVIQPLFLDNLYQEFENIVTSKTDLFGNEVEIKNAELKTNKALSNLLERLSKIKFFDPAVGSANFLIITYKEIRRLEMAIVKEMGTLHLSSIHLSNFYGIEINHFSAEIGKLSLWLAQHQMNVEFFKEFGNTNPTLPLQDSGNIVYGNAAQIDWETVCPKNEDDEIYIIGNPPFTGSRNQTNEQKYDLQKAFTKDFGKLDYVSLWYKLGAEYIRGNIKAKMALVSTNSICQGEQVALLWPRVLVNDLEICFAYQSFKWKNSARNNAGVTVIIVGIANTSDDKKFIFNGDDGQNQHLVAKINPYLTNGETVYIQSRSTPISKHLSKMVLGNTPKDGSNLVLENSERLTLINKYPILSNYIKKYLGSEEYINGKDRWCLWLEENDYNHLKNIDEVVNRIKKVESMRLNSVKPATREFAKSPYRFVEIRHKKEKHTSLIIPNVSSEKREYIPIGFLDQNTVISNSASAIYDPEIWIFGVICSKMHMVWVRAVGGKLEDRLRYSSSLIYNTFPFPEISKEYRETIERCVDRVIFTREEYPELTLAQLYDPKKMPENLRQAHSSLDEVIDQCYLKALNRRKPFENDAERLEILFEMYQKFNLKK